MVGGALSILSGVLGTIGIINYAVGLGAAGSGFGKGDIPPFVPSIIYGMSIPAIIIAILAITGGISAILRKWWGLSLAGSIAASLSLIILGIPAIVLIALSRDEFK